MPRDYVSWSGMQPENQYFLKIPQVNLTYCWVESLVKSPDAISVCELILILPFLYFVAYLLYVLNVSSVKLRKELYLILRVVVNISLDNIGKKLSLKPAIINVSNYQ